MKNQIRNCKSFKDRLFYLYSEHGFCKKGKVHFPSAADAMYKRGLKKYDDTSDEYGKALQKRSLTEILRKHTSIESAETISGQWIHTYCKFFGCSADFLMGYIDRPTQEYTDVSKSTGLNEKSLDGLQLLMMSDADPNCNIKVMPVLNALLSAGLRPGDAVKGLLRALYKYSHADYHIPVYHGQDGQLHATDAPNDQTIVSNYIPLENSKTFLLHLARSGEDLQDVIDYELTEDFLRSTALKEIETWVIKNGDSL